MFLFAKNGLIGPFVERMEMHSEHQPQLPAQSIETAGPKGKPLLEGAKAKLGFLPNMNMYAHMVNSPGLLQTYSWP